MEFLKWYLEVILAIPQASISPWGEYIWAIILLVTSSFALVLDLTPFFLLLTVPVFSTMAAHGYWRAAVRKSTPVFSTMAAHGYWRAAVRKSTIV